MRAIYTERSMRAIYTERSMRAIYTERSMRAIYTERSMRAPYGIKPVVMRISPAIYVNMTGKKLLNFFL